jgi:hypothetical protein
MARKTAVKDDTDVYTHCGNSSRRIPVGIGRPEPSAVTGSEIKIRSPGEEKRKFGKQHDGAAGRLGIAMGKEG